MRLHGKVQSAKVDDYQSGIEVAVLDGEVIGMMGKRPQYSCKIVRGWAGLDELRDMKKQRAAGVGVTDQDIVDYAAQIVVPQEDTVLVLKVLDITGKGQYHRLVCEVEAVL